MGYDPADVYVHCRTGHARNRMTKTKTKSDPSANIVTTRGDLHVLGSNNKLYRGRIDTCEIMPVAEKKERKLTRQDNPQLGKVNLDQLDQTVKNELDERLFAYLDWHKQFNEKVIVFCKEK